MGWSTSTLLRPVHGWFFVWEDVVPSLYRVVAVVTGAALTTVAVRVFGIGPTWLVAIVATLAWIGLGVAQEHDERVQVPADEAFVGALRTRVDDLLGDHGFAFHSATGGVRARRKRHTTVFYSGAERNDQVLWIVRDPKACTLDVRLGFGDVRDLAALLRDRGETEIAERLARAADPTADADAVGDALEAALAS